jgi:hypothetical protein
MRLGMGVPSLFLPYYRRNAAGHIDLELSIPRRGIILIDQYFPEEKALQAAQYSPAGDIGKYSPAGF